MFKLTLGLRAKQRSCASSTNPCEQPKRKTRRTCNAGCAHQLLAWWSQPKSKKNQTRQGDNSIAHRHLRASAAALRPQQNTRAVPSSSRTQSSTTFALLLGCRCWCICRSMTGFNGSCCERNDDDIADDIVDPWLLDAVARDGGRTGGREEPATHTTETTWP